MKLLTKVASVACAVAVGIASTGCSLRSTESTMVKRHSITRKKHRDRPPRVHRHVHTRDVDRPDTTATHKRTE